MSNVKRFYIWGLLVAGSPLWALPQENPLQPNAIEKGLFFSKENFVAIKVGYQGDVTWAGPYKTENGVSDEVTGYRFEMHMGRLFINILNQFEVYGIAGAAKGKFSQRPPIDEIRRTYRTSFHPIYGVGVRFIAFYWKDATLGFDGKYVMGNLPIDNYQGTWEVRRWQGAGALSYQFNFFVPYVGVRYSEVKDKIRDVKRAQAGAPFFDLKNRHRFGGSVGFGIMPEDRYSLNVEYRFYDEEGFSASFDLKF